MGHSLYPRNPGQAGRMGITYCSETPSLTCIPIVSLNRDPNPSSSKSSGAAASSTRLVHRVAKEGRQWSEQDSGTAREDGDGRKESVKSSRKENPIPRVSARNEAGSRDFGTDSAAVANYPSVWRSGLARQETATNGLLE